MPKTFSNKRHSNESNNSENNDELFNNLVQMGSFFYALSYFDQINQVNQVNNNTTDNNIMLNSNQALPDDMLDFNMMNNFNDDFDGLQQQLHFNHVLSQLVESYENIDKSFRSNSNTSILSMNHDNRNNNDDDEIVFLEEKNNYINKPKCKPKVVSPSTSFSSSSIKTENSVDDEICFLYEEEAPKQSNKAANYYDNDDEVDEKEVMKRWRSKKLSDPKINLSKTNYRLRLFNEKNAKQPVERRFKKCIFESSSQNSLISSNTQAKSQEVDVVKPTLATTKPNQTNIETLAEFNCDKKQVESLIDELYIDFNLSIDNFGIKNHAKKSPTTELMNIESKTNEKKEIFSAETSKANEENILNKRIDDIRVKYKELDREVYLRFKSQKESLNEVYKQQISMLNIVFEQQRSTSNFNDYEYYLREYNEKQMVCKNLYLEALKTIKNDFKNECMHIKNSEKNQIDALKLLYQSGKYEKGKLDQYCTVTVMQPAAKRRRYDDDGRRQVLLPEEKLRNIIIEDKIYAYYYGEPF